MTETGESLEAEAVACCSLELRGDLIGIHLHNLAFFLQRRSLAHSLEHNNASEQSLSGITGTLRRQAADIRDHRPPLISLQLCEHTEREDLRRSVRPDLARCEG